MATTVSDLLDLLSAIVPDLRGPIALPSKLPLINSAVIAGWKIITSRHTQHNWFMGSSQATDNSQANFFSQFITSQREYPLPPNFHQLRKLEIVDDQFKFVVFSKAGIDEPEFRADRESAEMFQASCLYDLYGTNPGSIMLAKFPPATLTPLMWYIRKPTKIATFSDSLDDFPPEILPMMAEYLAKAHVLGMQDSRFSQFAVQWASEAEQFVFGEHRDNSDRSVARGFMEGW